METRTSRPGPKKKEKEVYQESRCNRQAFCPSSPQRISLLLVVKKGGCVCVVACGDNSCSIYWESGVKEYLRNKGKEPCLGSLVYPFSHLKLDFQEYCCLLSISPATTPSLIPPLHTTTARGLCWWWLIGLCYRSIIFSLHLDLSKVLKIIFLYSSDPWVHTKSLGKPVVRGNAWSIFFFSRPLFRLLVQSCRPRTMRSPRLVGITPATL